MPGLEAGASQNDLNDVYRRVPSVDFSREILTPLPHRLLGVRDAESGWTDLGNPARVVETLVRNRIEPAWLSQVRDMEKQQCC
jgi:hypothetical protein